MSSELATAPVNTGFHKATTQLSTTLGIEPRMMVDTLKKQCFPGMRSEDISDAQLAAFISVANTMGLNPLIPGMLYAYPGKNGGIIPVSGPDGVLKKLDEHISDQKLDGYECVVYPEDPSLPPTHAVAKIWRKGSERPALFTAVFKEWIVQSNPNWQTRPRHMIWLRAIKQAARQVIHGVPFDEDDVKIGDMVNVTPDDKKPIERPAPPERAKKGANAVTANANPPIEAEIVDPKTDVPKPAAEEKKVDPKPAPPEPKNVTPPAEPVAEKIAAAPKPRTGALKDKEEFIAFCTPEKVYAMNAKVAGVDTPTIKAALTGDYVGEVFHFGGAVKNGDAIEAGPVWVVGKKLKLTLVGKFVPKTGATLTTVTAAEPAEASPASQDMSVD